MHPGTAIRVFVIDDHLVVRCGLARLITREPGMLLAGGAASISEAMELSLPEPADVVLLDLRLPDAYPEQAVIRIRSHWPSARILILDVDESDEDLYRALEAGASGCVRREDEGAHVMEAIRRVHEGLLYLPSDVEDRWDSYRACPHLNEDEVTCLRLLADGRTRHEIAALNECSMAYVRKLVHGIRRKLGARSQAEAVFMALRRGIVSVERSGASGARCRLPRMHSDP